MALLFISNLDSPTEWRQELATLMPDLEFRVWPEVGEPSDIEIALVWRPPAGELERYVNLKAILSLGAGVDHLLDVPGLPEGVPIARLIDPKLTSSMTEYVVLSVLRHHREFDRYERLSREGQWDYRQPVDPAHRRVGVMGLGVLGGDAARRLVSFDFDVAGWSRTPKRIDGVKTYHGRDQLDDFLARTEILVCLLPLTRDTEGIIDARTLGTLPRGAWVVNAARGGHVVDGDLLAALESGHIAGATLDVFREEPLPPAHSFWHHPNVLVTPHVASVAFAHSAAAGVVENIHRARRGERLINQVDVAAGY